MTWAKVNAVAAVVMVLVVAGAIAAVAAVAANRAEPPQKAEARAPKNADDPRAQEALGLLDKYDQTQSKLTSFIMNYETTTRLGRAGQNDGVHYSTTQLITDGKRAKHIEKAWGYVSQREPDRPKETAPYQYWMWDGERFYQYGTNMIPGRRPRLILQENMRPFESARELTGMLNRNFMRHSCTKKDDGGVLGIALRSADHIAVRPAREKVGGVECFVIDATIGDDKHTVWIDPEHDHQLARAVSDVRWTAQVGNVKARYTMDVTRFEKLAGVWVPMEVEHTGAVEAPVDTPARTQTDTIKCTMFLLNPDHDAKGSFKPTDVAEDSLVEVVMHQPDGRQTISRGKWRNGKPAELREMPAIMPPIDWN